MDLRCFDSSLLSLVATTFKSWVVSLFENDLSQSYSAEAFHFSALLSSS
ncbi:hypothetical protein M2451_004185 [Dysgonomonas sp. PFB1-18]|nr:hypothetical protein [Dysgonomonas sp. PF1-14]MDH6341140.1 hypothetical protein [Dysgonomonas sp. PF1-16]MDH6382830.1 hypothetical protein [Dysgonomonas sp. PFB1-18]MDH6400110.1 hypothetical protein [Dysgonomonas sp. PF1-23]